jgi:proteasome accessory factor A
MPVRLLGVETEYAVSGRDARGHPIPTHRLAEAVMRAARTTLPHLDDEFSSGVFLQNGGRLYVDAGQHPELTTPECSTPSEVVRYIVAGERIVLDLANAAAADGAGVVFHRGNVDYSGSQATWGCHESYMHRADPAELPAQLIPHLVSRIIVTGAGGFNNLSAGIEFQLSPRVPHLCTAVSCASTNTRGIFHTKDEPLCTGGMHRLHLICGESLFSHTASWLKVATTALVVALIEAGLRPGDGVALQQPLAAMKAFSADPGCVAVARTTAGRWLRAIDIQRHYLAQVQAQRRRSWMPPWAEQCCALWRAVLDRLEDGAPAVASTLDWAIKYALFRDHVQRRGLAWEALAPCTYAAGHLAEALARKRQSPHALCAAMVGDARGPLATEVRRLTPHLRAHGLEGTSFATFLDVRQELCEIDLRCGQLGDSGIFACLDTAGVLAHHVAGVDNIERAMTDPPAVPRAQLRGALVRELSGKRERYSCDWEGVWDCSAQRMIDLRDPFHVTPQWRAWSPTDDVAGPRGLRGRLHEHYIWLRDLQRRLNQGAGEPR